MTERELGFIGVGKMGGLMAQRLIVAGHHLSIFDTSDAAIAPLVEMGAHRAASVREVADRAEIVLASLPTPDVVRRVALGQDGICEGSSIKTFVDLSTTGPRVAAVVAAELEARSIASIDCPVSGGMSGARDGKLTLMVSGPRAAYDALQNVLEILGKPIFVSEIKGAAQTLKLANNLLAVCALAITSEALVMGAKLGLDPQTMCDVINMSSGRNTATVDKFPRSVLTGTFDFGFSTGLAYKDVRLCLDEAEALGIPTPVGSAVRQVLAITNAMFGSESDFTSMVRPLEQWAGVEVRNR
jgi:3-hydroxyisobutyrate dehydrogenase-like beta-hydroxyacid dehydrogenase